MFVALGQIKTRKKPQFCVGNDAVFKNNSCSEMGSNTPAAFCETFVPRANASRQLILLNSAPNFLDSSQTKSQARSPLPLLSGFADELTSPCQSLNNEVSRALVVQNTILRTVGGEEATLVGSETSQALAVRQQRLWVYSRGPGPRSGSAPQEPRNPSCFLRIPKQYKVPLGAWRCWGSLGNSTKLGA